MNRLASSEITRLQNLRRELHANPELSGQEQETAGRIRRFLEQARPDSVTEGIGGTGMIFEFRGEEDGPTVLFRSELDALPIQERNDFQHKSCRAGVGHKCGHDGHMSILSGFGLWLARNRPARGRVLLLFQPAEETGEGAAWMIEDPAFEPFRPDWAFALHNIPGFPMHSVLLKEGSFASASHGLVVKMDGETAHAAEPQNGRSPAMALSLLMQNLSLLFQYEPAIMPGRTNSSGYKDFVLITVIHAVLGSIAFGTLPGHAELRATLRSFRDDDMEVLSRKVLEQVRRIVEPERLRYSTEWTEVFPATVNHGNATGFVRESAHRLGLNLTQINQPFKWSEDFGHFTGLCKGALFGLGSGLKQPVLHDGMYDFPDELIETGVSLFAQICTLVLQD